MLVKSPVDVLLEEGSESHKGRIARLKYYGIYRGFVEYNLDPLDLGRVKVRVPSIHGFLEDIDEGKCKGIPTERLPWAFPCFHGSGCYDSGYYDVPLIGSAVWVVFEDGDLERPVYLGGWPSMPSKSPEMNTIAKRGIPDVEVSMGTWYPPTGVDSPREVVGLPNHEPTRRVQFKTPKGSTLVIEDKDEEEKILLIDRIGQVIEMYCPVTKEKNRGNRSQRGVRDARFGDALDPREYCPEKLSYIRILDAKRQMIKIHCEADKEYIHIHGLANHEIFLNSEKDKEEIIIKDKAGSFIRFDSVNGDINVKVIRDLNIEVGRNVTLHCHGKKEEVVKESNVRYSETDITYANYIEHKRGPKSPDHPAKKAPVPKETFIDGTGVMNKEYRAQAANIVNDISNEIIKQINTAKEIKDKVIGKPFEKTSRWDDLIEAVAKECNIDPNLVRAVMYTESSGNPNCVSHAGAKGLMQLMPATAKEMGVTDPFDPYQNLKGGACYLKKMIDRYNGDTELGLMAYNWGPGNVDKWLRSGRSYSPPLETQRYVPKVMSRYSGSASA